MSYEVRVTDVADAEADAIADWLALNVSVAYAANWYRGLTEAIGKLEEFPRMYPYETEAVAAATEIRRMLYYGPSGRAGGATYRVIYAVRDDLAEPGTDGVVDILHVHHTDAQPIKRRR